MVVNIDTAIAWMRAKQGNVTYSMDHRDGPYSYDCSSSVYYALREAGAVSAGWAVNTEYEHDWLIKNGYELISENQPWDAKRGDIFIWGRRGYSSGAGGHTGMFVDSDNIIHCNYARNGITVNDHDDIWYSAGSPYTSFHRFDHRRWRRPLSAVQAGTGRARQEGRRKADDVIGIVSLRYAPFC